MKKEIHEVWEFIANQHGGVSWSELCFELGSESFVEDAMELYYYRMINLKKELHELYIDYVLKKA